MKRWIRGFVAVAAVAAMLIPSAAMAEPKGPEMVHAGTAPTASITGRTITAQQLRQDSTLHGVYLGSPSSRGTNSRPDDARFTNIPVIRKLFTRIFDARPSSDIQPEPDQPDVDGAEINNLTVKWLNGDPRNPSHMIANPSDDTSLSFPARVDFQISGNHDHQPGEVEFTLPLTLFKDAQGNDLGSISLSVPEDPASGSVFTYQRLGDRIVVRNAEPIPASYEGYFEFSYTNITPHLVPSGVESAPIRVILHDVGNNATAVQATGPLTATVNTSETLLDVHKEGHFYENLPYLANLQPQNFDSSQYWYVDWYTSASVTGNRAFKLSVTDTPMLSGDDGTGKHISYAKGLIIGTDIPNATVKTDEQGNQTLTSDNAFSGYVQPGDNFFYHILMAYPLSDLPPVDTSNSGNAPVVISTAQNKFTYALTPERDDKTQLAVFGLTAPARAAEPAWPSDGDPGWNTSGTVKYMI